ncbi:MAG TPA: thioredoxin family protein [Gaiellaceae bacterium]|nr:thioredoxin family protein [Gaiellaceae bacterium]
MTLAASTAVASAPIALGCAVIASLTVLLSFTGELLLVDDTNHIPWLDGSETRGSAAGIASFERSPAGHPRDMSSRRGTTDAPTPALTLVFVGRRQSGDSRRMESLVAWVKVTQKKRLRVVEVDADRHPGLVERLAVTEVPALLLVEDRRVVGRLEGRATGRQIDELIRPHLAA